MFKFLIDLFNILYFFIKYLFWRFDIGYIGERNSYSFFFYLVYSRFGWFGEMYRGDLNMYLGRICEVFFNFKKLIL